MNGKAMTKKGFSLVEMLVVVGILALLASASVPVAELAFNTSKEEELQNSLESMREAINLYRRDCRNAIVTQIGYDNLNKVPFWRICPESLETLATSTTVTFDVEGKPVVFYTKQYLDRIPADPFVGRACWLIHVASGPANVKAAYNFRDPATRGYTYPEDFEIGNTGMLRPEPQWHGVFDVSCIASNTVDEDDYYTRRGFNVSVDGTLYEDW